MPAASMTSPCLSTTHWNSLSNDQQLDLTKAALQVAIHTVAGHAETLAGEMEDGVLLDRGGPDALRLLAAVLRASGEPASTPPRAARGFDLERMQPVGCA